MKRMLQYIFLSVFVCSFAVAQAESPSKTLEISLAGGMSYPYLPGDFKNYSKKGTNIEGGIGYSLQPGSLGYGALSLNVGYSTFSFDQSAFQSSGSPMSANTTISSIKMLTATATFKGIFSKTKKSIAPYFLLGAGAFYTMIDTTVSTSANPPSSNITTDRTIAMTWTLGAGLNFPVTERIGLFVEGRYVMCVTGNLGRQYFPVNVGLLVRP